MLKSSSIAWSIAGISILVAGCWYIQDATSYRARPSLKVDNEKAQLSILWQQKKDNVFWAIAGCSIGTTFCGWMAIREDDQEMMDTIPLNNYQATSSYQVTRQPSNLGSDDDSMSFDLSDFTDDKPLVIPQSNPEVPKQEKKTKGLFEGIFKNLTTQGCKGHLLVVGVTGTGKTSSRNGIIAYLHEKLKGNIEIFGSTSKADYWMGLENDLWEDGQPRVLKINESNGLIVALLSRLKFLYQRLEQRQEQRAIAESEGKKVNPKINLIILDEWILTLAIAKATDPSLASELIKYIEYFLIAGREDKMFIILYVQDHQVQNAGLNQGMSKNIDFIVLGSPVNPSGIRTAIWGDPKTKVQPLLTKRDQEPMDREAKEWIANDRYFAISWLGIDPEIVAIPDLSDIKTKKLFGNKDNVIPISKHKLSSDDLTGDLWVT